MQRSRRALMQRRALEKMVIVGRSRFSKVSLSLIFISWAVVLFCSLWISRGHGLRRGDSSETPSPDASISGQRKPEIVTCSSVEVHPGDDGGPMEEGANRDGNNDFDDSDSTPQQVVELVSESGTSTETSVPKSDRLARSVPIGLEDFKSRAFGSKSGSVPGQTGGGVIHRVELGGQEYNYASSSKGAKVLDFNKEAKGASNILGRDNDKYLRNPCSAVDKFVVIELSEETLVDSIVVANFEHYSSNLKDFELLGSSVYPTDNWIKLGNFTAANGKHSQPFSLQEPRWVRYLKMKLLSHYGSEFYCTLSLIEVFGVDAVELMLEDLINVQEKPLVVEELSGDRPPSSRSESGRSDNLHESNEETGTESLPQDLNVKREVLKPNVPDPIEEIRHQVGRMQGDTALKILMQKVRSLDLTLSVLEQYMEVINSRYGDILKELYNDLSGKHALIEKIRSDFNQLHESHNVMAEDVDSLLSWKSLVSSQLDSLVKDHSVLRSSVLQVRENQISAENKSIVVFVSCLCFGIFALIKLLVDILMGIFSAFSTEKTKESRKFCSMRSSWSLLLLSCSIIILILAL